MSETSPADETTVTQTTATQSTATQTTATDDPAGAREQVPDPGPPGQATGDLPWRRLAAGMLLIAPARELLRFVPLLVVLLFVGRAGDSGPPWGLIGAAAVIALGLARYLSTRFRITSTAVEIRTGLLTRHASTVPRERIRSVDVSADPLHRLLRLVRLQIGTGTSGERHEESLVLDGLRADEATALRGELLHRADPGVARGPTTAGHGRDETPATATDIAAETDEELARLSPRWIWYAPLTLSGVVTAAVLIGLLWRLLSEARVNLARLDLVSDLVDYLRGTPLWVDVAGLFVVILVLVSLLSLGGYVLAFWGFRLTRHPRGSLHIARGLMTTRAVSIDERRLRGVERLEPLLLRAARGARVSAITTGLHSGRGSDRSETLLPPGPLTVAQRIERAVLRDTEPTDTPLVSRPAVVRARRYVRALVPTTVAAAATTAWAALGALPAWIPVALASAIVPAALIAEDRYRSLGLALLPHWIVTRTGSLLRRRAVLARAGAIGIVLHRSYFQRRRGLTTLLVTTAAGRQRYPVPDLQDDVAVDVTLSILPVAARFATTAGAAPGDPALLHRRAGVTRLRRTPAEQPDAARLQ